MEDESQKRKIDEEIAPSEEESAPKRSRIILEAEDERGTVEANTSENRSHHSDEEDEQLDNLDEEHDEEEEEEEEDDESRIFYQQQFLRMEIIDEESLAAYLSTRELNENDYELLLRLDENVEKKTLKEEEIQQFKTVQYVGGKSNSKECCTVCLESIKRNEIISILPCKHEFHQTCIETWLKEYSKSCPLCKKEM